MHGALVITRFAIALAVALVPGTAAPSPMLPERDPTLPFKAALNVRAVVIAYFTASKNGDAKRAASLIDYDQLAKSAGRRGEAAKEWALDHQASLAQSYRAEKAAGSTKDFKIIKSKVLGDRAVFEVTQARAKGVYRWQVTLKRKHGQWACTGFLLLNIGR